ncbi:hypothetical protein LCGC14_0671610 [marine sediment metagenome]|uniref:Uncharacterized protein n=1 Tax=marine sediment metagenome TaxID=412755 RepID=A0A0F9RB18_9ZZZZ|nr:hypothetical protein [Candidatus Aminicenantes bacterium]
MIRLKIKQHDDNHIFLEALEGIDHFGFGTFLCNIQPEEVECDKRYSTEKSGLNGLEIWEDNRIAWGSPEKSISNMSGRNGWLFKIGE